MTESATRGQDGLHGYLSFRVVLASSLAIELVSHSPAAVRQERLFHGLTSVRCYLGTALAAIALGLSMQQTGALAPAGGEQDRLNGSKEDRACSGPTLPIASRLRGSIAPPRARSR